MDLEQKLQTAIRYHQTGKLQEAQRLYEKILASVPNHPDALHLLGVTAYQNGDYPEAIRLIQQAIRFHPEEPSYYDNLAIVLVAQKRHAEAAKTYRQALKILPDHVTAWYKLGIILIDLGEPLQAIEAFQEVTKRDPTHSAAHNSMGRAYKLLGKIDMALGCYKKALQANPQNEEALINTGSALQDLGLLEAAETCFARAVQNDTRYAAPYAGLACMMLSLGEITEVENLTQTIWSRLDTFLQEDPTPWKDELIYLSPLLCLDESVRQKLTRSVNQELSNIDQPFPFTLSDSAQRLKIGYVSPDFGDHPISHVLRGVFATHNRSHFEIFAYSLKDRSHEASHYYQTIRSLCDHFIDFSHTSNEDAVARIARDGIHILVDLCGYMKNARLEIFARRPAPVQIYWLGHGGGLGLSFIDYVIADDVVIPPEEESRYKEKIIRMPEAYHPTDTPFVADAPLTRMDFGLEDDVAIFCGFNNPQKINTEVFDVWMRILHRVPESLLWLSNPKQSAGLVQNLHAEAQKRGIDPARLVFAERLPDKSQHFARHQLADLFLDTFSYNASTTAIDALWAGLPIVTRPGNTFYSRICASFLTHIGLADMICKTTEEYENKAVDLVTNRAFIAEVKERLARNRQTEPLFNTFRFVSHLETAYRMAWDRFKSGAPPQTFRVPSLPR